MGFGQQQDLADFPEWINLQVICLVRARTDGDVSVAAPDAFCVTQQKLSGFAKRLESGSQQIQVSALAGRDAQRLFRLIVQKVADSGFDFAGEGCQSLALHGELELPPVFAIELAIQRSGKLLNLGVQGRLREVQLFGGVCEVEGIGKHAEGFESLQAIHADYSLSNFDSSPG